MPDTSPWSRLRTPPDLLLSFQTHQGRLSERPMEADCKSVAKATKVRILHLPPSAPRGPDQRQRWSRPLACTPVGYSALRARRCFCKPLTCGNVGARSVCGEYVGKSGSRAGVFHVPRAGDLRRCGEGY